MKNIRLLILLLLPLFTFSQNQQFSAIVLDANDNPIVKASVTNLSNNKIALTDINGYFVIEALPDDSLKIKPRNRKAFYYLIQDYTNSDREIVFINADDREIRVFEEVQITSSRIKNVVTRANANVVDYKLYKNGRILSLTSLRSKYWLNIEANDQVLQNYQLPQKGITELHHDLLGNIHLISRDSSFQVALSDDLVQIDVNSLEQFEKIIRPILYVDDSCLISGYFSNHNKAFRVIKKAKNDSSENIIHSIIDFEGLKEANRYYNNVITTYMQTVPAEQNIISNGIWTGNMDHLADGRELITMVMWYKNIISKNLNIYIFPSKESILIVDMDNRLVKRIDKDGVVLEKTTIHSELDLDKYYVLFDEVTEQLYCYHKSKPIIELFKIDLSNGTLKQTLLLEEVRFPKKATIFNGWLYFIKINDANFNKLYKVKVKSL